MSSQDPIALTFKGPHKTWWYAGSAIAVLFGLLVAGGSSSGHLDLDVTRSDWLRRDDGLILKAVISPEPITVTKLSVNGREDCKLFSVMPNKEANELLPFELKVGDHFQLNSSCRLIRVEIGTNDGSATYEFGG
jgi:hypothetical protein